MKKFTCLCITLLLFTSNVFATEQIRRSDINPDFLDYYSSKNSVRMLTSAYDTDLEGYVPSPLLLKGDILTTGETLPQSYDSRTLGYITPVKNQGIDNSCWTFSSTAATEALIKKNSQIQYDLSENHMRFSTSNTGGNNWGFNTGTNIGGNFVMSEAYYLRWSGPVLESDDVYVAAPPDRDVAITNEKAPAFHVQGTMKVPELSSGGDKQSYFDAIKKLIMDYGSAVTATYYDSVYFESTAKISYFYNGSNNPNHSVILIGWDDNYSLTNFNVNLRPAANGAFIVKNSHGAGSNNQGTYYLSYEDTNLLGGAESITAIEPVNNYDNIYLHDPMGTDTTFGLKNSIVYFANKFTKTKGEQELCAIGVIVNEGNLDCDFFYYPYGDLSEGGTLKGSAHYDLPGAYTYVFDQPVDIIGENFAVGVRIDTLAPPDDYGYYSSVGLEDRITEVDSKGVPNIYSYVSSNAGESYYSYDGVGIRWYDLKQTSGFENTNICIKAYTKNKDSRAGNYEFLSSGLPVGLPALGTVVCRARYTNSSAGNITAMMVSAVYENDKLINIKLKDALFAPSETKIIHTGTFNIAAGQVLKQFIWESQSTKPLYKAGE